ncbi:hypothetical protein AG1IA_08352 [Rhizoctonia solani AG-1 IA]|uniref:Uncharacterized protein n=1 Tax=Thanatephorus cucumeris (strain AG1-IA) TaxID=983506 RepID=L8WMP2_THACA|nr:hypothetical protein AG1IA_08352 [Rhizoctonia solani AG-1 IA]
MNILKIASGDYREHPTPRDQDSSCLCPRYSSSLAKTESLYITIEKSIVDNQS